MAGEAGKKEKIFKKSQRKSWPWRSSLVIVLLLICFYESCKLPKISGVVLDMESGRPIAGADVQAIYMGSNISLTSGRSMGIGGGGMSQTDAQGRFSFHSSFIPYPKKSLWLLAYSKDYMPYFSTSEGFNPLLDNDVTFEVKREGSRLKGYYYTIRLKKPETEPQWQSKIETVKRISMDACGGDQIDEWLFNDLVGYLERYPQGNEAGEYFEKLLVTQPYDCETLSDFLANGDLTKSQIPTYYKRNQKIVELADKVNLPTEPISANCTRDIIESKREATKCFESIMNKKK
jgi:hypothetical protein